MVLIFGLFPDDNVDRDVDARVEMDNKTIILGYF